MTTEKKFIDGMRYNEPREKAPAWVKGHISVNAAQFLPFMEANQDERGWLNIDIKESKGGKLYLELNTYRSGSRPQQATREPDLDPPANDDLPF